MLEITFKKQRRKNHIYFPVKACSPFNSYGACKILGGQALFNEVRYRNVISSIGSVIPFFVERAKRKLNIPLTKRLRRESLI